VTQRPAARKSRRAIRTLTLLLAVAGSLSAASASVTYQINSGGLESFNVQIDSTTINGALAGGIFIKEVSSTDPSMPKNYTTVCTDIGGSLYLGQSYTYDTPPTGFSGQAGVNPNWGNGTAASETAAIQNAAYLFYNYATLTGTQLTSSGLGGSTEQLAALQLAVWDVLYNTTGTGINSIDGTRFSVSDGDAAAITLAANWVTALNSMNDAGNFGYNGYLLYPDPESGGVNANADGEPPQELLMAAPVPEAPTVIAGTLLLLPFAASVFKIFRRKHNIKFSQQQLNHNQ